jgi:hypothetical protein
MAALTATDWTTSVQFTEITGKKRRNLVKCTLATAGTYTATGIPMPAREDLGMIRNVDYVNLVDPSSNYGFMMKYDQPNHALLLYGTSTAGTAAAVMVTASSDLIPGSTSDGPSGGFVVYVQAIGW